MAHVDDKPLFVWGGLPGELVDVRITKKKRSHLEGIVSKVHEASTDRVEPKEPLSYLSTSPWQIMTFAAENAAKQAILEETFLREGIEGMTWQEFYAADSQYGYRNKLEIGFWGDDDGLHLAHYVRASHGKQKVASNALAMQPLNDAMIALRDELRTFDLWAGDLKTLILRCNQAGEAVAALFVKKELDLGSFTLPEQVKGLDIYYSDPKSPASVPTKKLYSFGDITLSDSIHSKNLTYDVLSFFQVNVPVFEQALTAMKQHVDGPSIDMYSGVGSIGVAVESEELIESDDNNYCHLNSNVSGHSLATLSKSEKALHYIDSKRILIVDPPRAGLHSDLIERIIEVNPPKVIYLSCNPSTQARDIKLLAENYSIVFAKGFNFFPRTPHIESLIVLERR